MAYEERIEEIDLRRYWLVLRRRWLPASVVFVLTVIAALSAATRQKPMFEPTGKLLLRDDQTSELTGIARDLGDLESLNISSDPLATQAALILSQPVLEDTIRSLDLRNAEGKLIEPAALVTNLTVKLVGGTDLISVAYRSGDPALSAAVVNQVMDSYIKSNIESQRSDVIAAREFLEDELPRAQAEAENLSEALKLFNESNGVISLEEEAGATVSTLASLDATISQVQTDLVAADSQVAQLSNQLGMSSSQARSLATVNQSPAVQTSLNELQAVRAELANSLTRYTPNHPTVRALQRQEVALINVLRNRVGEVVGGNVPPPLLSMSDIDRTLAQALVQAEVDRTSYYNQLATLISTRDNYQRRGEVFPRLEQTQRELRQRRDATQQTSENLRQRLQEIQLAERRIVGSALIVEPAVPPAEATVEGRLKYLMAGAVVGTLLGIATAFFLDLIDRTLKSVKDGEELFGYVLLGVIPRFDTATGRSRTAAMMEAMAEEDGLPSRRIVTFSGGSPLLLGAYQMLQANLRFISSDPQMKVLVMTSSVAGEGKSEVCANLAAAVAQTNRRVLLVDADMRSPDQHHLWNLVNFAGLSHVLVGESTLEQAIQPVNKYLSVLPAGVVPPNPMALLDSERMAELVTRFKETFDYIIFDTPSLSGAADAAVVGDLADGLLMVMRPRHVSHDRALAAKSLLDRSGVRVLGMIANGVDTKNDFSEYAYAESELAEGATGPSASTLAQQKKEQTVTEIDLSRF
ncbi:MAG: polysaccharide biosynthesis tyrosine autokinase [Cyanobacteria bacterium P01_D01_bin.1]